MRRRHSSLLPRVRLRQPVLGCQADMGEDILEVVGRSQGKEARGRHALLPRQGSFVSRSLAYREGASASFAVRPLEASVPGRLAGSLPGRRATRNTGRGEARGPRRVAPPASMRTIGTGPIAPAAPTSSQRLHATNEARAWTADLERQARNSSPRGTAASRAMPNERNATYGAASSGPRARASSRVRRSARHRMPTARTCGGFPRG